jgi:uncharacterized protein (DUF1501 family)
MTQFDSTRRRVLRAGAATAALNALPGVGVIRDARAAGAGRVLVSIHLTGGNDTLNTVIPYANPSYALIRGDLAIPKASVLRLDASSGLHPSLVRLKALWDRRRVAIVHGVGYPQFDYSHFQAMEIHWTADPLRSSYSGWLGRALDAVIGADAQPDPLTGIAMGGGGSASLLTRKFVSPQLPPYPDWFWLPQRDDAMGLAVRQVLNQPPTRGNLYYDGFLASSRSALAAYDIVKAAANLGTSVVYPADNWFAQSLKHTVQLIRQDSDVRVVTVEQGAYDTHEAQKDHHAAQLSELDAGLGAFFRDLEAHGLANRVLVLLWSEFARRVEPNAQKGTDHGAAQAMVLIGSGVRAGIVGRAPSLAEADLVDWGNLPMQHDFRRVYATLLDGWIGVDSRAVLGATWASLPLLL